MQVHVYITFRDPVGVNGGIKDKRPCMHIKEKESRKKRTQKTESRNGVTARKVHSKCKKITIYVRGSGQGREGAGFMDGCVDVRVCVTETKKSQYTI